MYIWVCLLVMYNDDYDDYGMVWYGMFYVNMGMEDSGLVSLYDMYSLAWQGLYNPTSSLILILPPLHTHNLTLLKTKPTSQQNACKFPYQKYPNQPPNQLTNTII